MDLMTREEAIDKGLPWACLCCKGVFPDVNGAPPTSVCICKGMDIVDLRIHNLRYYFHEAIIPQGVMS